MNILVSSRGSLVLGDKVYKCALGKGGISAEKKEGDGATPIGTFPIRKVFYRADRIQKPESPFPTTEIKPKDGWCDDPNDGNYNKKVQLPYPASAEKLYRYDHVYDVIVVLGYNDDPVVSGKGSAIFMHVARPEYSPTEGCIALALIDLLEILKNSDVDTKVCIK